MNERLAQQEYAHEAQTASYDHQLRETNRAMCELQEAYKEKIRKCQAWEKVLIMYSFFCCSTQLSTGTEDDVSVGVQQCSRPDQWEESRGSELGSFAVRQPLDAGSGRAGLGG
jgi:hypothetical protein